MSQDTRKVYTRTAFNRQEKGNVIKAVTEKQAKRHKTSIDISQRYATKF